MDILGLNTLDLLLLVIILIGALIGLARGTLPQVISLFSIWLALVATLWLYKIFSFRILQGLNMGKTGADTLSFIIILIVSFHAVRLLVKALVTPPEDKRKTKKKSEEDPLAEAAKSASQRFVIGPLNMLGGLAMGVVLTTFWMALILGAAQFLLQPSDVPAGVGDFTRRMAGFLNGSTLIPMFNTVLWLVVQSVELFVPRDADILRKVVALIT